MPILCSTVIELISQVQIIKRMGIKIFIAIEFLEKRFIQTFQSF